MELSQMIRIARGDEPADLLLRNARLVNVFSGEIMETDIVLAHSRVIALGSGYAARETVDLAGAYVAPGLIDAHVHIESAMVSVREFGRAVIPHGITSVVIDPHEIANVLGLDGIRYMLEMAKYGPLSVYVMVPSCVPATAMETSGAILEADDIASLRGNPWVLGLAEMMNYPGVVAGDPGVLDKISAFRGTVLDGHAPGLSGRALNAYVAAGIRSDHECTVVAEAKEKLHRGMYIFIREATGAHNLDTLLPLVNEQNSRRICFCTDDRHPGDLIRQGSIDYMVRRAIAKGIDPITAIRMGTLNPSEYFGLKDRGAIAPGYRADMIVFDDLQQPVPRQVYRGGKLVAEDGVMFPWPKHPRRLSLRSSVNIDWEKVRLEVPAQPGKIRVIDHMPGQLVTGELIVEPKIEHGQVVADVARDILKMAVIERHQASGHVGLGFIRGIGLRRGAIASSVAHDHHNLVVVGVDDRSMMRAAHAVAQMRGGMVAVDGDEVLASVPLPVAGLMSDQPLETVHEQVNRLLAASKKLGSPLHDPFMAIGFSALEVIPALKLTDIGLVDVNAFRPVPLFVPAG